MGLLTVGTPLTWDEIKDVAAYVKEHGIHQFIHLYHRLKTRQGDCLKVRVSLRGAELLDILQKDEDKVNPANNRFLWRPEYAAYMLEGTPGVPYGGLLACFNVVENNMRRRRAEAEQLLGENETLLTIPNFPLLGCFDFTTPKAPTSPTDKDGAANSLFFPDTAILGSHPRFKNLSRIIRHRRGEKVAINVPIFRDEKTPSPFTEDFRGLGDEDGQAKRNAIPDHIYMDAMGFGMGCCCLQVTFQAQNVSEARWLYDQLTPITPVLLALSAATPIFRGYLADVDSRWDVIAASVDDRTTEERGLAPLQEQKFLISKSRYDTTDCYIYPCSAGYNDIPLQLEESHYRKMLDGGIDHLLAQHISHLFIRDPLQVYKERLTQNDEIETEHFETIQSSNWMNMRFKPPPPDTPEIGWRVEFRPTEVQLTDFENAAYVCFVVLLTRVIISFRLTFLTPISLVNENMRRAQTRDAVLKQKLYFRRGLVTCNTPPQAKEVCCPTTPAPGQVVEMSCAEIINGSSDFPGLVPLIRQYLDSADVDVDTRCTVSQYLSFIQKRATGEISTLAHWMRDFVRGHPLYKMDSVISNELGYELVKTMDDISKGKRHCKNLLGDFMTKSDEVIPNAVAKAEEKVLNNKTKNNTPSNTANGPAV